MDEQMQQQFIQWLSQKLGVQSEEELQSAIEQMGEQGVQQALQQFQQEMGGQKAAAYLKGGKLEYLKSLQSFKKGGKLHEGSKDGKTAVKKVDIKKKDSKTAAGKDNRKEAPKQWLSARAK